jgi:hypothetical protein
MLLGLFKGDPPPTFLEKEGGEVHQGALRELIVRCGCAGLAPPPLHCDHTLTENHCVMFKVWHLLIKHQDLRLCT